MVKWRDSRLTWPIQRILLNLNLTLISKYSSFDYQLFHFIKTLKIENLLDIGAHHGEFIQRLDRLQCSLTATAYEPSKSAVTELSRRHGGRIDIKNLAITEDGRTCELFEPGSPYASLKKRKDSSMANSSEVVDSITLLEAGLRLGREEWPQTLLKIDVQGSELEVLKSGGAFLAAVPVVVTEAPLRSFYEGAPKLPELLEFMESYSFEIGGIHTPRFNYGAPIDCDIIFVRRN